jgi:hypothetical protein
MARRECSAEYWDRLEANRLAKLAAPTKVCSRCKIDKPRDAFGSSRNRPSGLRPYCKQCHNAGNAKWREANPEKMAALVRRWTKNNPERAEQKRQRWYQRHPGRSAELAARWRSENIERCREISRASNRKRRATVHGSICSRVGNALRACLANGKNWRSTFSLLPYTPLDLATHIERQFTVGMSWESFLRGEIHIDHIRPLASFNICGYEDDQFRQAWALSNLRPLWARENLTKHRKEMFLV